MIFKKIFNRGEVKNITIVDIDEKSIPKVGQFVWRRDDVNALGIKL
jgi:CHASE2 domain-containing sensor protein